MGLNHDVDLPPLPESCPKSSNLIQRDQLSRKKLQGLLHLITGELKARGSKTPHIMLPFRSRVDDHKLAHFFSRVFPSGVMIDTKQEIAVKTLLREFDEFTLVCGLKYLWCRLPNDEVIGWNVYLEFRRKEKEAGYPKDAFLTIMPKCLSSSSHASIVYDFLDLLISIASNSHYNHLSGRKISKMAALWAFRPAPSSDSAFYDATLVKEVSFLEGLASWKQKCNGLFHLLLAFLRAMLPDTGAETLNLPKTLQSLLVTNSYPPPENAGSMKSVITIPCVHVRSTRRSTDPFDLIGKVRRNLSFEKKDSFLSIENYTILRNIFQKETTDDIVSTLTEESRRILTRLTAPAAANDFDIYPGWTQSPPEKPEDPNIPQYSDISISNVTLQDYFIWTWLSSLGSDQSSAMKSAFGRSIVVEAGLRGFQKWMVLTETTYSPEEYINIFKGGPETKHGSPRIPESRINADLPPPPPAVKPRQLEPIRAAPQKTSAPAPPPKSPEKPSRSPQTKAFLPKVDFGEDEFSLDSPKSFVSSPVFESRGYTSSMPYEQESRLVQNFQDQAHIKPPSNSRRPRPPPLSHDTKHSPRGRDFRPNTQERRQENINIQPPHEIPELQQYSLYSQQSGSAYSEPFDNYNTPYEEKSAVSSEPFDNYVIPGEPKPEKPKHLTSNNVQQKYYQMTPNEGARSQPRVPELRDEAFSKQVAPGVSKPAAQQSATSNFSSPERPLFHDQSHSRNHVHPDQQASLHSYGHSPGSEEPLGVYGGAEHRNLPEMEEYHVEQVNMRHGSDSNQHADYRQNTAPQRYDVPTSGYPNDRDYEGRQDGFSQEEDYRMQHARQQQEQEELKKKQKEERRKKKKKKRDSKQKELQKMMEQFPNAPPPSLPPSLQESNRSNEQLRPRNDKDIYTEQDAHHQAHHQASGVYDPDTVAAENLNNGFNHTYNGGPAQIVQDARPPKQKLPSKRDQDSFPPESHSVEASVQYNDREPPYHDGYHFQGVMVAENFPSKLMVPQQSSPSHSSQSAAPFSASVGTASPISKSPPRRLAKLGNHHQTGHYDRAPPISGSVGQQGYKNTEYQSSVGHQAHSPTGQAAYGFSMDQHHPSVPQPGTHYQPESGQQHHQHQPPQSGQPQPQQNTGHFQAHPQAQSYQAPQQHAYGSYQQPQHHRQQVLDHSPAPMPHSGTAMPYSGTAMPHSGTAMPYSGTAMPHSGTATPYSGPGPAMPHSGTAMPHSGPGPAMPHSGPAMPHSGTAMPHSGTAMPHSGPGPAMPHSGTAMPQYYPAPHPQMQGHQLPPQQYYSPPPQGYGYPPQGGYAPQGYFPPQPQRQPIQARPKPTTSDLAVMNMPTANRINKNAKNKAGLRAALNQGGFGI